MQNNNEINTKINFGSDAIKKYFKNTSWLFAEKVFKLVLSFVVNIYIIRYLGPTEFGILSYALSFVGLFAAISTLGLDSIIVRELVSEPDKRDSILGSTFFLKLIGALLSIILISITLFAISENSLNSLIILIISVSTVFQTINVVDFYFQAKVQVKYSAVVQFIALIISSIIKIILIIVKAPLLYFAIILSLESLFIGIGFLFAYKGRGLKLFNWKFSKTVAINLLKDSWPLILSGLVIAVYVKIDQVIIKNMLSDKDVGYYAAAVRISEAWYFIPTAICASLFPSIINARKISNVLFISRLQKLYDILTWLAYAIAIPITIFSTSIITLLFGNEFLTSASVLTIYIWAGVPVSLGVASSQYLISENFTRISFYRTLLGMIINVILNLILIPIYGIIGSAFATLISYSIATFSIGFSGKTFLQLKMIFKSILLLTLIKYIKGLWLSR